MTLKQKFKGIYIDDSFNDIEIDSLIFDCDGVLIDIKKSYDHTIDATAKYVLESLEKITDPIKIDFKIIDGFKSTGGFNDEVDLAYAAILCIVAAKKLQKDQIEFIFEVIKNADTKGLNIISNEIRELAKLAKTNSLTPEQYTGGSITVSNLGMFGISEFAAIISPPQASILAVGRIFKKPIVVEDKVVVGNALKSTLSADHRVLDGAVAGKLLKDFNDIIEDPFEIWIKSSDMEIL